MLPYQLVALYGLAQPWNVKKARILEIGTGQGASAYVLSRAAPRAQIVTLNPNAIEADFARDHLHWAGCHNVEVVAEASWDYLVDYPGPEFHLVFVDGDHRHVLRDLPWFNWLWPLGTMLFHDYSPRACPPVFEGVNHLGAALGRDPDVLIVDDDDIGMAGFCRRQGEVWRG